jgi:hypothetical protein
MSHPEIQRMLEIRRALLTALLRFIQNESPLSAGAHTGPPLPQVLLLVLFYKYMHKITSKPLYSISYRFIRKPRSHNLVLRWIAIQCGWLMNALAEYDTIIRADIQCS